MDKNDLTIVMQGYFSYETIRAYNCYKNFGKVIVSTWAGESLAGFDPADVIVSPFPPDPTNAAYNWQNLYFQVYSSWAGLRQVKTKFAIKVRADVIVSDLTNILEKLDKTPDKIISISHLFRGDGGNTRFHPSDILLAGKTEYLANGFEICKARCETHQQGIDGVFCHWAEQWIGTSLLKAKGLQLEEGRSKEIMQANFDIVSCRDLGYFHWKSTMYGPGQECNPYLNTIVHRIEDL